jgi:hypothetical protein
MIRSILFIVLGFLLACLFFMYTGEGRKMIAPKMQIFTSTGISPTEIKAAPLLKIVVHGNMSVYVDDDHEQDFTSANDGDDITLYVPR